MPHSEKIAQKQSYRDPFTDVIDAIIYEKDQMESSPFVSWIGAVTGILSLGWNIYSQVTKGPRLKVRAFAGMVLRPAPIGDPKVLKIKITNIGATKTTINNCAFHSDYKFNWRRFRWDPNRNAVLNAYQGPALPHKLDVGEEDDASDDAQ